MTSWSRTSTGHGAKLDELQRFSETDYVVGGQVPSRALEVNDHAIEQSRLYSIPCQKLGGLYHFLRDFVPLRLSRALVTYRLRPSNIYLYCQISTYALLSGHTIGRRGTTTWSNTSPSSTAPPEATCPAPPVWRTSWKHGSASGPSSSRAKEASSTSSWTATSSSPRSRQDASPRPARSRQPSPPPTPGPRLGRRYRSC